MKDRNSIIAIVVRFTIIPLVIEAFFIVMAINSTKESKTTKTPAYVINMQSLQKDSIPAFDLIYTLGQTHKNQYIRLFRDSINHKDSVAIFGDTAFLIKQVAISAYDIFQHQQSLNEMGVVLINDGDTARYYYGDTIRIVHGSSEINYVKQ